MSQLNIKIYLINCKLIKTESSSTKAHDAIIEPTNVYFIFPYVNTIQNTSKSKIKQNMNKK